MSNDAGNESIRQLTPYLTVHDAAAAIDFYKNAFGAVEGFRLTEPDGRIGHAELKLANVVLMLAAEYPEFGLTGPLTLGGSPVTLHLSVDNVDMVAQRAVDAGAKMIREPKDEFYGERSCRIEDPFGHRWGLSQTIEVLTPEEMQRRYSALFE